MEERGRRSGKIGGQRLYERAGGEKNRIDTAEVEGRERAHLYIPGTQVRCLACSSAPMQCTSSYRTSIYKWVANLGFFARMASCGAYEPGASYHAPIKERQMNGQANIIYSTGVQLDKVFITGMAMVAQ